MALGASGHLNRAPLTYKYLDKVGISSQHIPMGNIHFLPAAGTTSGDSLRSVMLLTDSYTTVPTLVRCQALLVQLLVQGQLTHKA